MQESSDPGGGVRRADTGKGSRDDMLTNLCTLIQSLVGRDSAISTCTAIWPGLLLRKFQRSRGPRVLAPGLSCEQELCPRLRSTAPVRANSTEGTNSHEGRSSSTRRDSRACSTSRPIAPFCASPREPAGLLAPAIRIPSLEGHEAAVERLRWGRREPASRSRGHKCLPGNVLCQEGAIGGRPA